MTKIRKFDNVKKDDFLYITSLTGLKNIFQVEATSTYSDRCWVKDTKGLGSGSLNNTSFTAIKGLKVFKINKEDNPEYFL